MESLIPYIFRFIFYVFFGLVLEIIFSVDGIERALGCRIRRRVPKKYLEGFVSLYMIPLHGLGLLFLYEPVCAFIEDWFILFRFCIWAFLFTFMEVFWGVLCEKVLGFYSWDYYADSKYKMFKKGYTLWTLVPLWGIIGLMLEHYSRLLIYLSPHVMKFFSG